MCDIIGYIGTKPEMAVLTPGGVTYGDFDLIEIPARSQRITWDDQPRNLVKSVTVE